MWGLYINIDEIALNALYIGPAVTDRYWVES